MIKNQFKKLFSDSFSVPFDSICDIPNAQFTGNKKINIEGCLGIKKYDISEIIIKCKKHNLTIQGNNLSMLTFTHGKLSITGIITSYQIEEI